VTKKIISDEDRQLFRHSVGDIHPLTSDKVLLKPLNKPKPIPKFRDAAEDLSAFASTASDLDIVGLEDSLSYAKPGLSRSILKKLRQGYFGLHAELDLHGLTSLEAQRQLLQFLQACVQRKYHCVHIVHGKGYRSLDNQPILKNNINHWLRLHKDVLAFCSAPPKDGGTGAVLVLLKAKTDPAP